MKKSNILIAILIVAVLVLGGVIAFLVIQNNQAPKDTLNTAADVTQVDTTEYNFAEEDAVSTVDQSVTNILTDIEKLDVETDFEDFDSELEFGAF